MLVPAPSLLRLLALLLLAAGSSFARDFHVREHGAVGDGVQDDGPALRRLFAIVSGEPGPSTIHFEAGKTYYLASPAEAHGRLLLREARGVTIEGHGATLRVRPPNRALGVYRAQDVVIRDLTIDYFPLPYVQGTIVRIDNRAGWLEFRPHPGYDAPVEGDSSLYVDGRNEDCVTFDQTTRKFYHAHSRLSGVQAVGDGVFRVTYREHRFTAARVGDFFAMKHRWGDRTPFRLATTDDPARRNESISDADPSLSLVHSDRVRLENIRSLAAPGMTLNARGCRDLFIQGLRLERVGDRLVAGNSDGIHIKGTESAPVIQDCYIEGTMDDSIHVKISGDRVTEVASPRRVRIRHLDVVTDNTNLGAGRRVLVWHPQGKRSRALTRIAQYEPIDCRQGWVTLEADVPGLQAGDALYLLGEGEARIERCRFGTQLQRAILTHQSTLIRDCEIVDNGLGIFVGFHDIEGPPTQVIRVEDCTFRDLQRGAISVVCPSADYDQGGDPQFIARGNQFFLARGVPAIQVRRSRGVQLVDNVIHTAAPLPSPAECFQLVDSPLREDRDNRVVAAPAFLAAQPVWPEGRERERNLFVEFRATFDQPTAEAAAPAARAGVSPRPAAAPAAAPLLRIAGATLYRFFVNGRFAGHGPAKAGHGFFRVDEWDLAPYLRAGRNELTIEVAGYNANSFYLLDQPSFLQAEIVAGDRVLAATGSALAAPPPIPAAAPATGANPAPAPRTTVAPDFAASVRHERVQKVQRYSFQRPFSEVWQLPGAPATPARLARQPAQPLAPRRVPYPTFALRQPLAAVAEGTMTKGAPPAKPWKDRSLTAIGPQLGGFPEAELTTIPSLELQAWRTATRTALAAPAQPAALSAARAATAFPLAASGYRTLDFGVNLSGFIGLTVTARTPTRLFVTFDEILTPEGDVDFRRLSCVNIVAYELAPGTHRLESFEPYTFRYLKLIALEGECEVRDCYLRELVNPDAERARFAASDERFNRIFAAARETFRQNAPDVFMDCPSRERAGWLCDSFFTARVALDLCGDTTVEKNFLENFQRPTRFPHLPAGMLPMCYPSDHANGQFIPNWAMWFVVQLEEYAARSGDRALVTGLRPRVLQLVDFFRPRENADGLLEKLPGWVFVEWSKANTFVQDVNYPSNMLYAGMLDAAARLYARPDLAARAARVRDTIRRQSFDGAFFVDNAVRQPDGSLAVTRNRTEVCQYFAFFFGIATPATHPQLWRALAEDFGPRRKQTGAWPEIHPANAFIGNQLRFELLSADGRNQQILDEAIGYWLYMAERTGTLWEHDAPSASCNHGFASHAAHILLRDVLGLQHVDRLGKKVRLRFADVKLDWCEGSVPTAEGPIEVRWDRTGDTITYRLRHPAGYEVQVENRTGGRLVEAPPR